MAQIEEVSTLPVTRVVLFTNGVGYFEHTGTVTGTQEIALNVAGSDMDDLLQSLVIMDLDGGSVQAVRYPSQDPLPRTLGSYSLDLSGNPSLAGLLQQARGERVQVAAAETISGVIVGVEQVHDPEGPVRNFLTLSTDAGLRRMDLAEVRDVSFDNAELRAELDAALAAIARHRGDDDKDVRLLFSGEGERRVFIAYVREMPVWKTSYRLVLDDSGNAQLQGWAIFDNPTSLDLENIRVSFVAGQPMSFITSLFAPVYVDRPRLAPPVTASIVPPEYEQSMRAAMEPMPAAAPMAMESMAFDDAADRMLDTLRERGVEAAASGGQMGVNFEYRVDEPVTIPRFESAMIPIVLETIPAQRLSVYDRDVFDSNPLRGVLLQNDTGLHLAAGTVTVFDGGGFAGNSRFGDVVPGADVMLTYAVDLAVRVQSEGRGSTEQVLSISLDGGLLRTEVRHAVNTVYALASDASTDRLVAIEHRGQGEGYEIVNLSVAPARTSGGYRLGVVLEGAEPGGDLDAGADADLPVQLTCAADAECELLITEVRVLHRSVALANMSLDQLRFYLANDDLSAGDRQVLLEVQALQVALSEIERAIGAQQNRRAMIFQEQERIRANMDALDRTSSLYQRYVSELTEQEDELAAITRRTAELQQELADTHARRDALFRRLTGQ